MRSHEYEKASQGHRCKTSKFSLDVLVNMTLGLASPGH
ncbi:hypothetical protein L861_06060 [Litchfieldella anticariensis FP35 = DSM 16096]|uniref:Uncharacterized protein n=1 Tax=Litchfieldella anticariensis (strain DSM 16096 / CECT 5854 / CIP 108499 / LMG 22089 / FP35) TaxID=1121939 RepID=S2L714_LITA3|nr:hypothetical protein L861_06060 [Halomonas anticariensis FP35 = DSM 16096]